MTEPTIVDWCERHGSPATKPNSPMCMRSWVESIPPEGQCSFAAYVLVPVPDGGDAVPSYVDCPKCDGTGCTCKEDPMDVRRMAGAEDPDCDCTDGQVLAAVLLRDRCDTCGGSGHDNSTFCPATAWAEDEPEKHLGTDAACHPCPDCSDGKTWRAGLWGDDVWPSYAVLPLDGHREGCRDCWEDYPAGYDPPAFTLDGVDLSEYVTHVGWDPIDAGLDGPGESREFRAGLGHPVLRFRAWRLWPFRSWFLVKHEGVTYE